MSGLAEYASRLEGAIERHRQQVMSLGLRTNAKGELVWGGQYDAELWAVIGLPDRPRTPCGELVEEVVAGRKPRRTGSCEP